MTAATSPAKTGKATEAGPHAARAPGKRERNKQSNRASIIEAARKCFLKLGYDAVTVRDVVRKTGLAAGTFYNYFTDKDVLFQAVLEARVTEISKAMHAVRIKADTVEGFIYSAYFTLFQKIAEDPSFFRLILRNEHAVRSFSTDPVIGIPLQLLKADLKEFIERGVFPQLDVDHLAAAFYGIGFELGRLIATTKSPNPEASAQFATRLVTSGVKAFGISRHAPARRKKGEVLLSGSLP